MEAVVGEMETETVPEGGGGGCLVEEEETLPQPAIKEESRRRERVVRRIDEFSDSGRRRDNWTEVQIRDSGGRRAGLADRVAKVCGMVHRQECLCYGREGTRWCGGRCWIGAQAGRSVLRVKKWG